jgi:hypothetical protein
MDGKVAQYSVLSAYGSRLREGEEAVDSQTMLFKNDLLSVRVSLPLCDLALQFDNMGRT